ncbi:clathrin interactor EPSIN 2-like [Zingiber officinale]|uniref:clathrin interactor EPSIN 2-like n=1 Tax=Zingiber officinale TaxID=94328 RepID=UPI001C4D5E63|nr:clathrin interactor EPSIN 2-like [Zingiber officinale]
MDNRRSTTEYVFTVTRGPICWKSLIQHIVSLFTTESKYIVVVETIKEALWLASWSKNWVFNKASTVLEYLVGNGSERVIDDMREHAYQILILSDFQYIDSSGRDQGHNVRRKSQALVALINDKERIQEVRFQSTHSSRPDSYPSPRHYGDRYDDDHSDSRYASRDDDLYGNWKERDWGYKDDDRSVRVSDPYGR